MKSTLLLFGFLLTLHSYYSQVNGNSFKKENYQQKTAIPYPSLSERDVMYSKRIWRVMDLREKMNHPYYYPVISYGNMRSLFSLIEQSIKNNELTVYDAINDEFTLPLSRSAALEVGMQEEDLSFENPDGSFTDTTIKIPINTEDIIRFRIKEDWFFDKQRGVMEVRIIGICPVAELYDQNGDFKGELPLYWIYFPEIRGLLAQQETVSRWNDAEQRTYDEMFSKRFFSSYIYKISNVYNRRITDYKLGTEAQLEAQLFFNQIFDFEQDLWEY